MLIRRSLCCSSRRAAPTTGFKLLASTCKSNTWSQTDGSERHTGRQPVLIVHGRQLTAALRLQQVQPFPLQYSSSGRFQLQLGGMLNAQPLAFVPIHQTSAKDPHGLE